MVNAIKTGQATAKATLSTVKNDVDITMIMAAKGMANFITERKDEPTCSVWQLLTKYFGYKAYAREAEYIMIAVKVYAA
jgi:hypothetical protein